MSLTIEYGEDGQVKILKITDISEIYGDIYGKDFMEASTSQKPEDFDGCFCCNSFGRRT